MPVYDLMARRERISDQRTARGGFAEVTLLMKWALLIVTFLVFCSAWLMWLIMPFVPDEQLFFLVFLFLISVSAASLWWRRRTTPPIGFCVHCGYNLKGNLSGRCPECGRSAVDSNGDTKDTLK